MDYPIFDYAAFSKAQQQIALATANPNANPNMLLNLKSFNDDPMAMNGALTEKRYADWKERFAPTEDQLMGMTSYMDKGLVGRELSNAVGSNGYVTGALNAGEATQQYGYQKYGMQQTAEGMQAQDTRNGVSRSTAVVDAANKIRQKITARDQAIAVGSSGLTNTGGATA